MLSALKASLTTVAPSDLNKETNSDKVRKINFLYLVRSISYRIVHQLTLPCLYFGLQIDIENAVEAVEQLKLTNSQEKEQLEWQEIIFDLIRTIKVR